MRKLHAFSFVLVLSFVLSFFCSSAQAQVDLIENGSFETGDFTGWTVVQEPGSSGDWFVYSGSVSPFGFPVLPPPDGTYAAITDQEEPSSQVLYQDIDIPAGGSVQCSVVVYYENRGEGGTFASPSSLSYLTFPNQQARIDIMDPSAGDFDVGAGVLENLFQTNPGDPLSLGYTRIDFDLSTFAGSTVRFRAAEVDNLGVFNFSVDDVMCRNSAAIPTLGEWGMIAMAGVLGLAGLIFTRRRRMNFV